MFNLENISRMLLLAHQILAAFVIGISAAKLSLGEVIGEAEAKISWTKWCVC